jgi:N-carbamoylputrescine amidase
MFYFVERIMGLHHSPSLGYSSMMKPLRVAYVEWPENLSTGSADWDKVNRSVADANPDLLVTNELPFGAWLAENPTFSDNEAHLSLRLHAKGLQGLISLDVPAVISSRPVWNGKRLANEAFVLEKGIVRPLHRKQYFSHEPGWYENEWYAPDDSGFAVAEVLGINVGVLLCTDAMFNEHARSYGKQKASLIVIPRASGTEIKPWKIAGAMASLISGAYVVSSNRVGFSSGGTQFGGGGFAYAPQGRFLKITSPSNCLQTLELDPELPMVAQRTYPCYVSESDHAVKRPCHLRVM